MKTRALLALTILFAAPTVALASGGHDAVGCAGCHSIHAAKGALIFAVPPNTKDTGPAKEAFSGTTALCLGCHQDADKGGMGIAPISRHVSHPYGLKTVNAKVAKVPGELLREGGRFECLGCHDPHPSNPYYKYLRVDTGAKGQGMDKFCAVCHPMKADQAVASTQVTLFTSMDETGNRALAPVEAGAPAGTAPAKAPKKKSK